MYENRRHASNYIYTKLAELGFVAHRWIIGQTSTDFFFSDYICLDNG